MFENLTNKFEEVFSSLKKAPSLDESQVDEGLRAIRQALLEADVSLNVATLSDTSASNKACLMALRPSSTWLSSSEGAFFREEKTSSNLFVKFSNIFITHSSNRTSGRTLAD